MFSFVFWNFLASYLHISNKAAFMELYFVSKIVLAYCEKKLFCNGNPRLCLVMSTSLTVPGIRQGSLLNSLVGYDLFDPSLNR